MVFVKRETTGGPKTLDFRNVIIALVVLAILLIATFYAHNIVWDDGAKNLMTAFTNARRGQSVQTSEAQRH